MEKKIYYSVLEDVVKFNAWDTPFGKLALELEKRANPTHFSYYHDPKEHLKLFLNNWIVEKAFIEAYKEDAGLKFIGNDHEYFNGIGHYGADCIDIDGDKIEIKTFANLEKLDRWLDDVTGTYDAGYGCQIYLMYCKSNKTSYCYYVGDEQGRRKCNKQIKVELY